MLAYHGRQELKDQVLVMITAHEQADRLVKGSYDNYNRAGEFASGCAVGCTLESIRAIEGLPEIAHNQHDLYERYLGVPRVLARLEDALFESLPTNDSQAWPRRFTQAIRPGADLSMVWPRFIHKLLSDPNGGVQCGASKDAKALAAVQTVVDLYGRWLDGDRPVYGDWISARSAAYAADAAYAAAYAAYAAYAADAAAYADAAYAAAYAADAADAAADAAAYAAAYAAYAAYAADAAAYAADADADARAKERRRQADTLIALLEEA